VIMTLTGIQISKLVDLKVYQVKSLFESMHLEITLTEGSTYRANLSSEGQKIIKPLQEQFERYCQKKELDSYLFTIHTIQERDNIPLSRESLARDLNRQVSSSEKKRITAYSFRKGYIDQLWEDIK